MRKLLLLTALILSPLSVLGQVTPNLGLNVPAPLTPNWGTLLNNNFNQLDMILSGTAPLPALSVTGPASLPQLGTWQNTVTYTVGEIVAYHGIFYSSLSNGNVGNQPPNSVFWTTSITPSLTGVLLATNNLSEFASSPAAARGNLGLGSAAVQSASAFDAAGSSVTAQSNVVLANVKQYGAIGNGASHQACTTLNLGNLTALQAYNSGQFSFATACTNQMDWLAAQYSVNLVAATGGQVKFSGGPYMFDQPLILPLSQDASSGSAKSVSLVGDGEGGSIIETATADFGAGSGLISCGLPGASYSDNSGAGSGRYGNVGACYGTIDGITLFNPFSTGTTNASSTSYARGIINVPAPSAAGAVIQMDGFVLGGRMNLHRVGAWGFRMGFNVVGDHMTWDQLDGEQNFCGLYFAPQSIYLGGDITIQGHNFINGNKFAGTCVDKDSYLSGVVQSGTLYMGYQPYAFIKFPGIADSYGQAYAGTYSPFMLNTIFGGNIQAEQIGNALMWDDNLTQSGGGVGTPQTTFGGVQIAELYAAWGSGSNQKITTGGRGSYAWIGANAFNGFKIFNIPGGANNFFTTTGQLAGIILWNAGSSDGGLDITGDLNSILGQYTAIEFAGLTNAGSPACQYVALHVPGQWDGGEVAIYPANTEPVPADLLQAFNFQADTISNGTQPVTGVAMQYLTTNTAGGQCVAYADHGFVTVLNTAAPTTGSLMVASTTPGKGVQSSGTPGYAVGTVRNGGASNSVVKVNLNAGQGSTGSGSVSGTANQIDVTSNVASLDANIILPGTFTLTNPGVFSNTANNFPNTTALNGCNIGTIVSSVQFQYITSAISACVTAPTNSPGTSYNQSAGGTFAATASGIGSGTGASRAVGVNGYALITGNGTSGFGGNVVVQDVSDSATGQLLIGQEVDTQPQKASSSYAGNGANVVGVSADLYNQGGQGGTYGPAFLASTHSFGTQPYWAEALNVNQLAICPSCPAININSQGNAISGTNRNGYNIFNAYENYWNGATSANMGWAMQPVVGSGTNPTTDFMQLTHALGTAPAGLVSTFELAAGIRLQLDGSTSGSAVISTPAAGGLAILPVADKGGQVFNVKSYGALGNTRYTLDGAITASSTTLSSATAAFTSADTGKSVTVYMGAQYVLAGTYTSGITATGTQGQTCTLTITNGGGSGATATIALNNTNSISSTLPIVITAPGTGFTSAPTAATASNGTATCSGTATIATVIAPAAVTATATYVNATSVTLGAAATTTVSAGQIAIGTDDTVAANSAISACSAAGGGKVFFPQGFYKINSTSTKMSIASGCSFEGVGPGSSFSAARSYNTQWLPTGGSWLECAGSTNCITGNMLNNVNLLHLGFMNWAGQAAQFGGNGVQGLSYSSFEDLGFFGVPPASISGTSVSDQGIQNYNFLFDYASQVQMQNMNICLNIINQSSSANVTIQGGNSTFVNVACTAYAKSVANANWGEAAINLQALTPSSGTALPLDYITFVRPQVNAYNGDGTANAIAINGISSGITVYGVQIQNADIEGKWANGVYANYMTNSDIEIGQINQQTAGANTIYFDSGSTINRGVCLSTTCTYKQGASGGFTNLYEGYTTNANTNTNTYGIWGTPSGGTVAQFKQLMIGAQAANFSSSATGLVNIGTGNTVGTAGSLDLTAVESGGTKFTATGCTSISSTLGGATAGSFVVGANTCTVVITMNGATGFTASNGWSCHANDKTTAAGNTQLYFSASSATTATLSVPATAAASDVIDFACTAY